MWGINYSWVFKIDYNYQIIVKPTLHFVLYGNNLMQVQISKMFNNKKVICFYTWLYLRRVMIYFFNITVKWSVSNNCMPLSSKTFLLIILTIWMGIIWGKWLHIWMFSPLFKDFTQNMIKVSILTWGQDQLGSLSHFVS